MNYLFRKNTNCSIEEGLERAKQVIAEAKKSNIPVRGFLI